MPKNAFKSKKNFTAIVCCNAFRCVLMVGAFAETAWLRASRAKMRCSSDTIACLAGACSGSGSFADSVVLIASRRSRRLGGRDDNAALRASNALAQVCFLFDCQRPPYHLCFDSMPGGRENKSCRSLKTKSCTYDIFFFAIYLFGCAFGDDRYCKLRGYTRLHNLHDLLVLPSSLPHLL